MWVCVPWKFLGMHPWAVKEWFQLKARPTLTVELKAKVKLFLLLLPSFLAFLVFIFSFSAFPFSSLSASLGLMCRVCVCVSISVRDPCSMFHFKKRDRQLIQTRILDSLVVCCVCVCIGQVVVTWFGGDWLFPQTLSITSSLVWMLQRIDLFGGLIQRCFLLTVLPILFLNTFWEEKKTHGKIIFWRVISFACILKRLLNAYATF